jgi:hypothetical protein
MSTVIRAAMKTLMNSASWTTPRHAGVAGRPDKVKPGPPVSVGHCMSGPCADGCGTVSAHEGGGRAHGVDMVTEAEDSPHRHVHRVTGEGGAIGFAEVDPSVPDHVKPALKSALKRPAHGTNSRRSPTHHGYAAARADYNPPRRRRRGKSSSRCGPKPQVIARNAMPTSPSPPGTSTTVHGRGYPCSCSRRIPELARALSTNPAKPGVPQDWLDPIVEFPPTSSRSRSTSATRVSRERPCTRTTTDDRSLTISRPRSSGRDEVPASAGACIGVSFALALEGAARLTVSALVLQNPIGLSPDNRAALDHEFEL